MNNIILWIVGVVILAGGGYFFIQKSDTSPAGETMLKEEVMVKDEGSMMEKKDEAMTEKKEDPMMKDEGAMMQKGSYEAYAAEKLAKASTGDVVLFFRASWCPTCKAVDADIRAHLASIPAGLTILDVNYDDSTALKQKYGVTYQHTFVQVNADGTLIKKWSGSPTLAALVSEVQ
jgi:thiol-disulfide isomerase/thioredoxin